MKLECEKYEECLKLSILEKQTEITEKIKQNKKIKPRLQRLGSIIQISKGNKKEKKMRDMGTGTGIAIGGSSGLAGSSAHDSSSRAADGRPSLATQKSAFGGSFKGGQFSSVVGQ